MQDERCAGCELRILDAIGRLWPARNADIKASAVGPLIVWEPLGQPVWAPRDYAAFAREGFMQNAIVYRSVRMIAEAAASVPLLLYEGDNEISEHPLLELIAQPSPDQTTADFLEAWYGFLLVAGNAYVEAVGLSGRLRELHVLRPDRMKVIPVPDGWPEAFEYSAAGRSVRFEAEPVRGVRPILHVRLFHPVNDHYGMSPIEAAANAIDIHNAAGSWNKALLDNAARPSGALVYAGSAGNLTGEQYTRLKSELEDHTRARGTPGGRCCWRAGSTGRRCRCRLRTWTSSRRSTPPRARSRWRWACRRCCWASRATTRTRTTRKRSVRFGGVRCCRWSRA